MTDAFTLTIALGGKWHRSYGVAPCPLCQPTRRSDQNALTVADGRNGRLVLDCKKSGCNFLAILAAAGLRSGNYTPPDPKILAQREHDAKAKAEKQAAQAKRLWAEALPIVGTPAEAYLRGRGITSPLPPTLRFHGHCWHGATAKRHPALIAAVQGVVSPAVHRTYLSPCGAKKAEVEPAKAMLGAVSGGAVRLCEASGPLVVGEGIESTLSLLCGLLSEPVTLWAALSTSGMRGLRLPRQPRRLIIATDGDAPGRAAGNDLADRAHALGWQVSILPAPTGYDFNDILTMKGEIA